jgi:hypothetical protein
LSFIDEVIRRSKVLVVGEVRVSRVTPDKAHGRARYAIYLPLRNNNVWEELWKGRRRVRIVLEVADSDEHVGPPEGEGSPR